jgi:hypothetical protein
MESTPRSLVVPAPGRHVRDPATRRPVPPEGQEVVLSGYWLRRVLAGDLAVVVLPKEEV